MPLRCVSLFTVLAALSMALGGGCPGADILLTSLNTVQVELINDTGFPVDPNIRFDDDSGFWASLVPAEHLEVSRIESGEGEVLQFDCDELGLIFSDEAVQLRVLFDDYVADSTKILERGDDYDCGDVIRFRFVGDGPDFGVIVSINGRIVD
jgi:hypothetical protein